MIQKLTYISLGILIHTFILITSMGYDTSWEWIPHIILFNIGILALELMIKLFYLMITDNDVMLEVITPQYFFCLFFMKKLHYNGLHNLYIFKRKNRYWIFKLNYLRIKKVSEIHGCGDIDEDIKSIKSSIELEFKKDIQQHNLKNKYKKWDGSVDQYSRREKALEDLGI